MTNRRTFIQKSMLASAGISLATKFSPLSGKTKFGSASEKMIGIQMGGYSFYDEGFEYVLDILQKEAFINTLMIYSHTYYSADNRPANVLADDHGVDPSQLTNRKLTKTWVKHDEKFYNNTSLRHHNPDSSYLFSDKDIFNFLIYGISRQKEPMLYLKNNILYIR